MSYSSMIDKQISIAFNKLKDLAIYVELTKTSTSEFDFGTSTVTNTTSTVVTKAVITETSKRSKEQNSTEKLMMLKTKEVGDLKAYEQVQFEGQAWKIVLPLEHNGYVTMARLVRAA